ncbi:lipase family protein [Caulobacter hibisci]|uniref:DUF2974 domain-containing protein n=1 Tax=Caulobacter hibisci TaxID=2035993 RepID=A0ABS0T377_9CAUL|nr:DUF2974 domain-containing protein [Caulobacter hibisci]MBI1686333.1 DUF2974 domain-containing protein [Caulobacter hibisci]
MAVLLKVPARADRSAALAATIRDHVRTGAPFGSGHAVLAALSAWVYRTFHKPSTEATEPLWIGKLGLLAPVGPANDKPSGYDAFAFYAPGPAELVVVNRGTDSELDWLLNFKSAVLHDTRTVTAALAYALAAHAELVARGLPVNRVTFTGHSLGGAMAEAQAALFRQAASLPVTLPISATGFASAPFAAAIRIVAAARGGVVDAQAIAASRHYIRPNDPIHLTDVAGTRLAPVIAEDLNLYGVVKQTNGPPKSAFDTFSLIGNPIAHDSFLYHQFWDRNGAFHIVRHLKGAFHLWDEAEPERTALGRSLPPEFA